jgi:uncharacterized protein YggE
MMRSSFIILCLSLAACSRVPADPRGVARDEVLLRLITEGDAETRPDEARFTAGVDNIAPSAGGASAANNAAIAKMIAAVDRLGVKPRDVQTRSITLSRIDYGPNRGRYQANNTVEIRLRDLKQAGAVIAAITDAGANVLSGPELVVSDPEAASRSAYAQAYKAARARADTYAEAAGLKVARVLAISDAGGAGPPDISFNAGLLEMDKVAAPAPPVRAGMNRSSVQVRVDFALSAK